MKPSTNIFLLLAAAFMLGAPRAEAQPIAERMALGDAAAEALNPMEALAHYEAIVAADSSNAEALWKVSMNALDAAEFMADKKLREELYRKGEVAASRAVAVKPNDAEVRFHMARALGMAALSVGVKERINYAREIREHALEALRINPSHSGALHVMGVWHAEVMRISGIERTLAKAFMGAAFFSEASWEEAIRNLERAVAVEPERIAHHLDLARVYRDRKMNEKARSAYQAVLDGKSLYYNDATYKEQARAELAKIR